MKLVVVLLAIFALTQGRPLQDERKRSFEDIIEQTKDYLSNVFKTVKTTNWIDEAKLLYHKVKVPAQAAVILGKALVMGAVDVATELFTNLKACPTNDVDTLVACTKEAFSKASASLSSKRDLSKRNSVDEVKSFLEGMFKEIQTINWREKMKLFYIQAKTMAEAAALWAKAAISSAPDVAKILFDDLKKCPTNNLDAAVSCISEAMQNARDALSSNQKRDLSDIAEKAKDLLESLLSTAKESTSGIRDQMKVWIAKAKLTTQAAAVWAEAAIKGARQVASDLYANLKACPRDDFHSAVACVKEALKQAKDQLKNDMEEDTEKIDAEREMPSKDEIIAKLSDLSAKLKQLLKDGSESAKAAAKKVIGEIKDAITFLFYLSPFGALKIMNDFHEALGRNLG